MFGLEKTGGRDNHWQPSLMPRRNSTKQWILRIAFIIALGILVIESIDLSSLIYRANRIDSSFNQNFRVDPAWNPLLTSESAANVVTVKTISGLQKIPLAQKKEISLEFPFTSFYAELTVETGGSVTPVIVDRGEHGRKLNFTLALGVNTFDIELRHGGDTTTAIVEKYKFNLTRRERTVKYVGGARVQVCYLEQDCDLIIYPDRRCGPQAMKYLTPSQRIQGYWKLKCNSCRLQETCLWSKAEWIERGVVPSPRLLLDYSSARTCLKNYQMRFLGDSTIRGLMLALMEKVNTTLNHIDRNSSSTNNNLGLGTNFSLTYYNPYHRNGEKSTFAQRLQNISAKYLIDGEAEKTILVVGGTQWLKTSQLSQVKDFISRWRIPAGNVFIKLHGSAFHIFRERYVALKLQPLQQLIADNNLLRQLANNYGFGVIDTLQMTLSRFKEFQTGYCACHFHWMKEYSEDAPKFKDISNNINSKELPPRTLYHMVGDINSAYTDILIRQICDHTLS